MQKKDCWRAPLNDFAASYALSRDDRQGVVAVVVCVDVVTLWVSFVDLVSFGAFLWNCEMKLEPVVALMMLIEVYCFYLGYET